MFNNSLDYLTNNADALHLAMAVVIIILVCYGNYYHSLYNGLKNKIITVKNELNAIKTDMIKNQKAVEASQRLMRANKKQIEEFIDLTKRKIREVANV
ncbi:MAG: hypothetical protein ACPG5B_06710 [Chitinophagales bacterium]